MSKLYIKNENQCKTIFKYCKERLPILNGFELHVQQPTEEDGYSDFEGVKLILTFGDKTISKWHGVDEDDALLCIYKDLVLYFKELSEHKPIIRKALNKNHLSMF